MIIIDILFKNNLTYYKKILLKVPTLYFDLFDSNF